MGRQGARCGSCYSTQPTRLLGVRLMGKFALLNEFVLFLRENKKLWLLPIVITLLLVGALLVFAQGSALAPFIYTIF